MDTPKSRQEPRKVTAQLSVSCGCGFVAKSHSEALAHAEQTNHLLTVQGVVGTLERLGRRVQVVEVRR